MLFIKQIKFISVQVIFWQSFTKERKMLNNPMVLAVITAIGFGGWPLITRNVGVSPIWTAIIVSSFTFIAVIAGSPAFNFGGNPMTRAIVLCTIAGLINGVAFLAYTKLVTTISWDLSVYVPISLSMMLLIPFFGGWFLGEEMTISKLAGVAAILVGVYLLR